MELTKSQKLEFYREGFLKIEGAVPRVMVAAARQAINACPDIRYAVIFRARHVDIKKNGMDVFTDIWREWDGIRAEIG